MPVGVPSAECWGSVDPPRLLRKINPRVREEPQTPTYLPSARNRGPQESARSSTSAASDDHHHQDGVVRAEHDVESLESREGVDVLSMLLSVVTAATGTSLVNGASAPDLQIVSDLVSQATTNPNEDAAVGDAAAATENTSEPSDPPPATTNDSTEAAQPPSAQNEESTSPEASSPSSRTRIPNFIRNRMLGQDRTRTISLPSSEAESSATTGGASSLQSPSSPPPRLARAPASAPSSRSQLPRRPRTASNDAHTPLVVPLSRARTESADPHHQHDHRTTTARTRASSPARRSRAELDNDAILHLRSQLTQQLTRALQNNTLGAALEAAGPQIPRPPRPQQRVMSQGAATAANTPTLESLGDLTIPPFDPERVAARRARDAARQSVDEEIPPSQQPAFVGGREQSQERQQQTESPSLTPTADSEPYVVRQESTTEEDVRQHVREEIVAAREMERAEAERNGGRDDAGRSQTPRSQSSSAVPPSPPPVQPESPISAPSSPRPTSALPSIFSSPLFRPASVSPQAIVGQSGSQPMTFGRFLVDIQRDLRVTLGRRNEIERARRERQQELDAERATTESSTPSTVAAASSNAPQSQLPASSVNAPRADSEMTPAERDAADAARIRGRHLEPHVPSVDQPLNWWRMFRFPPRDAGDSAPSNAADNGTPSEPRQLVPLLIVGVHQHRSRTTPAVETERAARRTQDMDPAGRGRLPDAQTALDVIDEQEHDDSSSSDGDSTAGEDSDSEAGPGSNADSDSDAESEEMPPLESVPVNRRNRNSTLGSILGRGRADARRPSPVSPPEEELTTQSSASASTQPSERRSLLGRLFPPPSPSRSSSNSRPSTPRDSRTSPPTSRQPSTPSPPPHDRTPATARARGARHQRESQVLEEESYVIWVVGGYYPEEMVETMVPHILLGHFDQSDLW
ncbi:hypothetical protein DL93DRAFT_108709 [Clavulina sp. PMI_390]|nr:hypothetical protein DL93DRAFT_108709 [Clavulina sp. PMI_390]